MFPPPPPPLTRRRGLGLPRRCRALILVLVVGSNVVEAIQDRADDDHAPEHIVIIRGRLRRRAHDDGHLSRHPGRAVRGHSRRSRRRRRICLWRRRICLRRRRKCRRCWRCRRYCRLRRLISSALHAETFIASQLSAATAAECHTFSLSLNQIHLSHPGLGQPPHRYGSPCIFGSACRCARMRMPVGMDRLPRLDRLQTAHQRRKEYTHQFAESSLEGRKFRTSRICLVLSLPLGLPRCRISYWSRPVLRLPT